MLAQTFAWECNVKELQILLHMNKNCLFPWNSERNSIYALYISNVNSFLLDEYHYDVYIKKFLIIKSLFIQLNDETSHYYHICNDNWRNNVKTLLGWIWRRENEICLLHLSYVMVTILLFVYIYFKSAFMVFAHEWPCSL